jgi:hypothetical protein
MARTLMKYLTVTLLGLLAGTPLFSQTRAPEDASALKSRVEQRFQILPLANGVLLTPKFKTTIRSIEVTDAIAVDGATASGRELQDKLGPDANLVLQISYLDPAARRALAGAAGSPVEVAPPSPPPPPAAPSERRRSSGGRKDDLVRFGGSVSVGTGETVTGDVVAIGGSGDVDGEVLGDVVVIGGSLTLGPHARIRGDATVVGGRLNKDPGATIDGDVSEVGLGDAIRGHRPDWLPRRGPGAWRSMMSGFGLGTTVVRVALVMLLAAIVLLVARRHVQQIADRAAAEPVKAWAVGFLVEILFVPVLVLTIVALAVSIIGIPLLLLVPVAIVGFLVVCLVGMTGVAFHIGRLIEGHWPQLQSRPYLPTIAGIGVIVAPLVLGRLIGVVPGLGVIAAIFIGIGFLIEYIAWTTGLGAAALTRFGRTVPPPALPPVPQV